VVDGRQTLTQIANFHGTDKGTVVGDKHGYTEIYEFLFGHLQYQKIRLLEIGAWKGSSLRMWKEYFSNADIFGIENFKGIGKKRLIKEDMIVPEDVRVFDVSQNNKIELQKIAERYGAFDIIIDDGSHKTKDHLISLSVLLPFVNPKGYYVIEDLHGRRCQKTKKLFKPQCSKIELEDVDDVSFYSEDKILVLRKK